MDDFIKPRYITEEFVIESEKIQHIIKPKIELFIVRKYIPIIESVCHPEQIIGWEDGEYITSCHSEIPIGPITPESLKYWFIILPNLNWLMTKVYELTGDHIHIDPMTNDICSSLELLYLREVIRLIYSKE